MYPRDSSAVPTMTAAAMTVRVKTGMTTKIRISAPTPGINRS